MPEAEPSNYGQTQSYFPSLTPQERQEYLEEINGELAVHLSVLYFMLEILRGDPTWADDLSKLCARSRPVLHVTDCFCIVSLDPPLPIYLFSLVAGLREKNAKGYPVKKVRLRQRHCGIQAHILSTATSATMEVIACMLGR